MSMSEKIQLREEVPSELGGQRLDQVAAQLFAEHSRSRLSAWIKDGRLTVDGAVIRPRDIVHGGSVLELTAEQEAAYRLNLESYRQLERDPDAENRETRMLDLDNAFHRRAFELCGMEEHFDHMLSTFQHIERLRKFSLQTEENKSVCAAHTRILEAVLRGSEEDLSRALSDHLNRYKLSVEQARQRHPEYFTEGTVRPVDYHI